METEIRTSADPAICAFGRPWVMSLWSAGSGVWFPGRQADQLQVDFCGPQILVVETVMFENHAGRADRKSAQG